MELFDKIYNCYYNVIRHILEQASEKPVSKKDMEAICRFYGYQESDLYIVPKLTSGVWPFLQADSKDAPEPSFTSCLLNSPKKLPLTLLQKSWIKALLNDKRFCLFFTDQELEQLACQLEHIKPLYAEQDFYYFDQYRDGDPYDSPEYRNHFQLILRALAENKSIAVTYESRKGHVRVFDTAPYQLQYSSKDDKFRLCCLKFSRGRYRVNILLNLNRIKDCLLSSESLKMDLCDFRFHPVHKVKEPVVLEISGERNSLERCMLHFASYEKHTEYDETQKKWLCSIYYDMADETELLIDVLSFGPVIRVLGPEPFLAQVRSRVKREHELLF